MENKVMQPPGGECHDLFGASFRGTPSHLRVLKPPGGGSSDIFGANGQEPSTPEPRRGRNHQSSSLFLGDEMDNKSTSSASSNKPDGNPVTGEGYENAKPQSAQLSNGGSVSSQNGTAPPPSTATAASARQRVPPGGFSSGLW